MTGEVARERAAIILAARAEGRPLDPFTDTVPLTMDEAYEVQANLLTARLDRGERQIGWKLGYSSPAMRVQ
ncbi:MAG: hypothetical protein GEV00_22905, partial [Actinophytocola sp.]|nr:hypothetical protein [Actinophytocola sp.]